MTAALIGLAVIAAAAAAGVGPARWIDGRDPPGGLGAALGLAVVVVAGVDVAAVWRFTPVVFLGVWALAIAAAWLVRRPAPGVGVESGSGPRRRLLVLVALLTLAPLLVLPVPLDTDAQGFGMLALAIRDGGTIDSLAPWRPDILYLYSPGALALFAAVSALAPGALMSDVMSGTAHAAAVLFVWLAWDFGRELERRSSSQAPVPADRDRASATWPWATAWSAALAAGFWSALFDAHYTAIVGLLFSLAFVVAILRAWRTGLHRDVAVAAVALAAVPIAHADSATIAALGVVAFGAGGWIWVTAAARRRLYTALAASIALALVFAGPWLASLAPLVGTGIASPYGVSGSHARMMLTFHGIAVPLLAVGGAIVGLKARRAWAVVMMLWLALVAEASVLGWVQRALSDAAGVLVRFTYPYSVAWHGPIVPYVALGAGALVLLRRRFGGAGDTPRAPRAWALVTAALIVVVGLATAPELRDRSRPILGIHGAFASDNDVLAMRWIRAETPPAARVLNYPGDQAGRRDWEAHWAPVLTERDCVYFRMQLFFLARPGSQARDALARARAEQTAMLEFWRDPANPAHAERLRGAGVQYVLVPESVGDPASLARAWRWQPPALLDGVRSTAADAVYLRRVFEAGGARVYRVVADDDAAGMETAR
jgi:hypothetical protein